MKIISLNIWDARIFDPLMDFFDRQKEVDVFCLQEVFHGEDAVHFRGEKRMNGFSEIAKQLPHHEGYFAITENLDDIPPRGLRIPYGLAIFVKKGIEITGLHTDFIFSPGNFVDHDGATHNRAIQTISLVHEGRPIVISHVHGLWNGKGKTDTPERLGQSRAIRKHVESFGGPLILLGDFNLLPETESLAIVKDGMRDLVHEYGVTSTRSKLYTKHEKPVLFADYAFVTPDLPVQHFEVLQDVVSDHLPLLLEIK